MNNHCESYELLSKADKDKVGALVRRMCGKANIAHIEILGSDLPGYKFKVEVYKYNSVKGWATIGYIGQDAKKGFWLTYQPKTSVKNSRIAGKTGAYS